MRRQETLETRGGLPTITRSRYYLAEPLDRQEVHQLDTVPRAAGNLQVSLVFSGQRQQWLLRVYFALVLLTPCTAKLWSTQS